jgi:hypothetical protein
MKITSRAEYLFLLLARYCGFGVDTNPGLKQQAKIHTFLHNRSALKKIVV